MILLVEAQLLTMGQGAGIGHNSLSTTSHAIHLHSKAGSAE